MALFIIELAAPVISTRIGRVEAQRRAVISDRCGGVMEFSVLAPGEVGFRRFLRIEGVKLERRGEIRDRLVLAVLGLAATAIGFGIAGIGRNGCSKVRDGSVFIFIRAVLRVLVCCGCVGDISLDSRAILISPPTIVIKVAFLRGRKRRILQPVGSELDRIGKEPDGFLGMMGVGGQYGVPDIVDAGNSLRALLSGTGNGSCHKSNKKNRFHGCLRDHRKIGYVDRGVNAGVSCSPASLEDYSSKIIRLTTKRHASRRAIIGFTFVARRAGR
jgi:hypothetical protein